MDIMLDLETLGTAPGCVVLSIGAVGFDGKDGFPGHRFHAGLQVANQVGHGLKIDPSTALWWLGQSDDARNAMLNLQKTAGRPYDVLEEFSRWLERMACSTIWSNGADFDLPVLAALYHTYAIPVPWKYNAGRCCRTIMQVVGKKMGDFGTPNPITHDALSDATFQAAEVSAALYHLSISGDQTCHKNS